MTDIVKLRGRTDLGTDSIWLWRSTATYISPSALPRIDYPEHYGGSPEMHFVIDDEDWRYACRFLTWYEKTEGSVKIRLFHYSDIEPLLQ